MRALSPTGSPIRGTLETISGTAHIEEFGWFRESDGSLGFEYDGYADIDWNSQETVKTIGDKAWAVFIDENGDQWGEDDITLSSDEEDGPAEPGGTSVWVGGAPQ